MEEQWQQQYEMIPFQFMVNGSSSSCLGGRNTNINSIKEQKQQEDEDQSDEKVVDGLVDNKDDDDDESFSSHQYQQYQQYEYPIVYSDVSLSFWGGIDPLTGIVIDTTHPLYGQCITNTIFCLPSGRGSCTASQVLLELLLNQLGPRCIVLRDIDPMVSIGAIVAQEILYKNNNNNNNNNNNISTNDIDSVTSIQKQQKPFDIIHIGRHGFDTLSSIVSTVKNDTTSTVVGRIDPKSKSLVVLADAKDNNSNGRRRHLQQNELNAEHQQIDDDNNTYYNDDYDKIQHTDQELELLASSLSDAQTMALNVIFRYARLCTMNNNNNSINNSRTNSTGVVDVPKYVPISCSHIDGCTYIGPGGIQFVQQLVNANGKVIVPTTLNSVSADRQQWRHYNVPTSYALNSIALGDAYLQLGCQPSFTCAPYLLLLDDNNNNNTTSTSTDSHPHQKQSSSSSSSSVYNTDMAWGESNAVVYANTVLGARTEKYADYLDICCAIAGIVPQTGVHIPSNRIPTILLDATVVLNNILHSMNNNNKTNDYNDSNIDLLFPTIGYLCGLVSDGQIPILIGFESWKNIITTDHLKSFCAAYGTTGSTPLIHIAGITPEVQDINVVSSYIRTILNINADSTTTSNNDSIIIDSTYYVKFIDQNPSTGNVVTITEELLEQTFRTLNQSSSSSLVADTTTAAAPGTNEPPADDACRIDLIAIGNPHLSITECQNIAKYICHQNSISTINNYNNSSNDTIKANTRIVACMSRTVHSQVPISDIQTLTNFGIEFVFDTCWCMILDEPLIPPKIRKLNQASYSKTSSSSTNNVIVDHSSTSSSTLSLNPTTNTTSTLSTEQTSLQTPTTILTNSGKYAHYGPALTGRRYRLASMKDCLSAAWTGYLNPTTSLSPWSTSTKRSITTNSSRTVGHSSYRGFCTFQKFDQQYISNVGGLSYYFRRPTRQQQPMTILSTTRGDTTISTSITMRKMYRTVISRLRQIR